jgi:hypothetical protein
MLVGRGVVCIAETGYGGNWTAVLNSAGRELWRLPNACPVYLAGDTLVTADLTNGGFTLRARNWRTQEVQWVRQISDTIRVSIGPVFSFGAPDVSFGGAVVHKGLVYLSLLSGTGSAVEAIRLADGELVSLQRLEGGWGGGIGISGNWVFTGISHWLHALNPATLAPQWALYDGGNTRPLCFDGILLVQGYENGVGGLNPETRKWLWGYRIERDTAHSLVRPASGRPIVVEYSLGQTEYLGLDAANGDVKWRCPMLGGLSTSAAGDLVFLPGGHRRRGGSVPRGGFYAVDGGSGVIRWKYERPSLTGTAVVAGDGSLFGWDEAGYLYRFSSTRTPMPRHYHGHAPRFCAP